jgi:hypothetical protein
MDSLQETRPATLAAFELSTIIPGSVYVEAKSPNDVLNAIRDLNGVPKRLCINFVPLEERLALLSGHFMDIEASTWVHVSRGRYHNDLGYVQTTNRVENEATILLVPQLSPDGKASRKGNEKRVRPRPYLFDLVLSSARIHQLDHCRVEYKGHVYRGGLVEKTFSYHQLRLATPTAEELHVFGQSQGVEASVMATSWSKDSVAAMAPDAQVRMVSGEQSGLTGHILSITGDTCQFCPESPP